MIFKEGACVKLMFASDIHGSYTCCKQMIDCFDREKAERLFILGDILYHGPRNDLPEGYSPKETAAVLNSRRDRLFCVRGNCDSEVDQMVLDFPIMAEYALLYLEGRTVFLTHGHIYNKANPPLIGKGDILIHGHTHVQTVDTSGGYVYINPGSVSIPKEGRERSFMIYEDGVFTIKRLADGKPEAEFSIKQ